MLLVGDRVVLRAAAPPEAEFALFEIGDIELRSSEPGRVREHGYQTTAGEARARLAQVGATAAIARECAEAMQPVLSAAYARGPAVQHVAKHLGASELFQSDGYDASAHVYRGHFLELPTLVHDLDLPGGALAIQALYLALLLENEPEETTVFLSTDAWTKIRKPGERTHRRPNLGALRTLRDKLGELAARDPKPSVTDHLARADVIAFIRSRADAAPDDEVRGLYAALEKAITVREIPERGPLADPALWAVEVKLDAGNFEGVLEAVDEVERSRGRTPGTTYLRARASLALRLEPPKLIAERISALALSMTSFQELSLLAAESWLEAGDSRRAMPYARDLVDAPGIEEGLLLRAQRLLARAVGAAPDRHKTYMDGISAAPMPPSSRHPAAMSVSAPEPHAPRAFPPERSRIPTERGSQAPQPPQPSQRPVSELDPSLSAPFPAPPPLPSAPPASPALQRPVAPPPPLPGQKAAASKPPPLPPAATPPKRRPAEAPAIPSAPPPIDLELTPQPLPAPASFTLDLPGPEAIVARGSNRPPPVPDAREARETPREGPAPRAPSQAPPPPAEASRLSGPPNRPSRRLERQGGPVKLETRAPPAFDPRAEPESERGVGNPGVNVDDVYDSVRKQRISSLPPPRATRDSTRPQRASNSPPEPSARGEDPHARPTPLRPPPAAESPFRAPMETPVLDADLPPTSTEEVARTIDREKGIQRHGGESEPTVSLHGASLPPFRLENPPPLLAKAPLLPRMGTADELVEHLALPPGLSHDSRSADKLPQSVLEARVAFTHLARELGLDYRLKRGIELRADVSGIEAMQAVLLEAFADHTIKSSDDAYELRRHGALLSEILARRLDAEWIDISPNELGYWSMIVPPDTRVWPFGRVARLIEMGHKERDLVSYFLELSSRARGR